MAKKDLKTDNWEFNNDLDFDFGGEIDTGMSQSSAKSRSPIANVGLGIAEGTAENLIRPGTYQKILKASLPSSYGDITTGLEEVGTGIFELYDQTRKEVKPRINQLTKAIDKFIPDEAKTLKKLSGKILALSSDDYYGSSASEDPAAAQDQAVAMMMGEIFKAQAVQGKISETKQIMRDAIDNKRYARTTDISARMQRDISIIQQYTTNVTQAYQKKSLEIQLRTYLGQQVYFKKSIELMEIFKKQNEAIVKNTFLSDAAKTTEAERLKLIGKEKLYGSLYGDGSAMKRGMDNLKQSIGNIISGAMFRADMGIMGAEMIGGQMDSVDQFNETLKSMGVPPMTKEQMLGAMASDWVINAASDWASPKLKKLAEKNPGIEKTLAQIATFIINPAGKISAFKDSDRWKGMKEQGGWRGGIAKAAEWAGDHWLDSKRNFGFDTGKNGRELKEGHGFDTKAHLSLTTVIPGYLSMIQHEVASLRTGISRPYYRFDYSSGKFKTDSQLRKEISETMTNAAKRSGFGYKVNEGVHALTNEAGDVSATETGVLKQFITDLSQEGNIDYNAAGIEKSKAFNNLDSDAKAIVKKFVNLIETSDRADVKIKEFTSAMKGVRDTIPGYRDVISEIIEAGHGDLLEKEGHVKGTRTGYGVSSDYLHKLTADKSLVVDSDMNVKEDIRGTTPAALLKKFGQQSYEGMMKTPIYDWKYKKGVSDGGKHSGPMAQDVQKNLGDAAAPGGKKIDVQTMNGSFFAAIQYLGGKIENLKKPETAKPTDPLANIDLNVARIAAMMSEGGAGGGGSGPGGYRQGFDLNFFLDKGASAAGSVGRGVSTAAGAVSGKISELWRNNKDQLKDKAVWLFNKTSDLAGTVFDASKNFVKNTIPDWVGKVKDFGKRIVGAIGEQFQTYKDLYLPDGAEPVIRAAKLKAGEYYDEIAGVAIMSAEQLSEVKGNVVDKAGNIIVSAKEVADGLYDRYGERFRSRAASVASFAISAGKYVGGKLLQAAGALKDMVSGGAGKIKEWWDNSPEFKFPEFGVSFYDKKSLAELINIRDVLLGDARAVRKRIKKADVGSSSGSKGGETGGGGGVVDSVKGKAADLQAKYAGEGSILGKIFGKNGKLSAFGTKAAAMATVATRGEDFMGPMSREEMEAKVALDGKKEEVKGRFQGLKDRAQAILDKHRAKKNFVGPMPFDYGENQFMGPMPKSSRLRRLDNEDMLDKTNGAGGLPKGYLEWRYGKHGKGMSDRTANLNAQETPSKLKGFGDKVKGFGGRLKSGIGGRLGGIASFASGLLGGGGDKEPSPGAGVDGQNGQTDQQAEAAAFAASEAKAVGKRSGKVSAKDRDAGDKDGDGVKDGSVEERQNKIDDLKASRDKGMLAADTSTKYKSPENVLDTIAKKASGVMEMLTNGFGTVFNVAKLMFSGGSAVVRGTMSAVSGLTKGALALNAATGGTGAGFASVARGVWTGVRMYSAAAALTTTGAMAGIASAASLALTAAAAVAGTVASVILAPPVLIAAGVALAASGLYLLYKYSNRDNCSPMERLRLRQYGFGRLTTDDRFNHHVYMLESYLEDGRISYNPNGVPSILHKKVNIKEMLSLFEIDEKDKEGANQFSIWFDKRFKPVFFTHLASLLKVDKKKKLREVNDLTPDQKLRYLEGAKFTNGPYNEDISPFGDKLQLDVNDEEIMQSYDNLILEVSNEVKKKATKHKGIAKPEVSKDVDLSNKLDPNAQKIDAAKVAAANSAANSGVVGDKALGEGDGSGGKTIGGSNANEGKTPDSSGPINMAPGTRLDGVNGMQFVKLRGSSKLDGISPAMLKQFLGMAEEYGKVTGKIIPVNSGSRTFEQQRALYAKDPSKASKPGNSVHELGLAIDIDSSVADELDKLGLMKKYGFTRPVGGEPWHIEPAAIQRSLSLAKNNASEREIMIEQSMGRGGGGYGSIPGSKLGKRNQEIAMQVLGSPSKFVASKTEELKAVNTPKESTETKPSDQPAATAKAAANDPSASKTKDLPSSKVVSSNAATNASTVSPDAESSKVQSGSSDASSSSGGSVDEALENAARKTGVSLDLLRSFAAAESGMDPNAKSRTSRAQGLMQFMPETWAETVSLYGKKHGLPANASPFNAEHAALMGAEYIKNNMKFIKSARPNPSVADLYLIHLLGPSGARTFFNADPSQRVDMVIPTQAAGNPDLFYANGRPLTVGEAYNRVREFVQTKASAFGIKVNTSEPGLKAPSSAGGTGAGPGVKLPSSGGVAPKVSGPEPTSTDSTPKRGFSYDSSSAGYVPQSNQSGQRNDSPPNKLETLMEKSNDTAEQSLKALNTIVTSLSEERLAKVLAMVISATATPPKEESVKEKDQVNMGRTASANGPSLDLKRRTAA